MKSVLLFLIACLTLSGCAVYDIQGPNQTRARGINVLSPRVIEQADLKNGTLKGYANKESEFAAAVVGAAVAAGRVAPLAP